ncbi:MAG: S24/S26 family peptidase [Verrucomicrobia bacterium]|nr:S24/S26 family peptidase [Verrucomicrobiota bacterium]
MTFPFWRERLGRWPWSLPALLLLGLFWGGCAGPAAVVEQPSVKAVPSTDVGRMQAWRDAEDVTARDENRVTVIGAGDSMLPVYGEGTVLVLHKIAYADLETGMQVAYIDGAGHQVVHVLVSYDAVRRGWRVRGLNNQDEDRERVTPYNLIGVVYASFAPGEGLK